MTNKAKDPIVYALSKPSRCFGCDLRLLENSIVKLQNTDNDREVLCRICAELETLEVLPSGNAAITRLAKKYSKTRFVIVKWSETWKCYERQGLLLEPQAIDRAEQESGQKLAQRQRS
jgi:hypothetical protein